MTELDEVAQSIWDALLDWEQKDIVSYSSALRVVENHMRGESRPIIDEIAECLYELAQDMSR